MGLCKTSKVNVLAICWIFSAIGLCGAVDKAEPHVPAMFIFGDSLADAGTNNFIPHCAARANFPPYGVSFFARPTGRFTNGRTAFDFIATYLRLPFPPPFLRPNATYSTGINFASGSSGLLDSTGNIAHIINMSHQISQFEHYSYVFIKKHGSKQLHGAQKAKKHLAKSLYCITAGGNDIGFYIANATFQKTTATTKFVAMMLTKFEQYATRLYRAGARKFLVLDIPAVGCTPYTKLVGYQIAHGGCLEIANQLAVAYNNELKSLISHMNEKLEGVSFILFNSYDYLMNILDDGEAHGFSDTKNACCGSGLFNTSVTCGKTTPQDLFCNDTNAYVFWDGTHPTERFYAMASHQIWTGNSSVIYPYNLSNLVMKS